MGVCMWVGRREGCVPVGGGKNNESARVSFQCRVQGSGGSELVSV